MTQAFDIQFFVNRFNGQYLLKMADISDYTGVLTAFGFYRIEYPDGIFWENTNGLLPDFSLSSALTEIPLRMKNGQLMKGQYRITQKIYSNTGYFQSEKIIVFSFEEPVLNVSFSGDLTAPIIAFSDSTNYTSSGYTVANTRVLNSFFPSTSAIPLIQLSTTGAQLIMVSGGFYYEGIYEPNLSVQADYTAVDHDVVWIKSDSFTLDVRKLLQASELYDLLEVAKQRYDSAKGGPGEKKALEDYQTSGALIQQIRLAIIQNNPDVISLMMELQALIYSKTCGYNNDYDYLSSPISGSNEESFQQTPPVHIYYTTLQQMIDGQADQLSGWFYYDGRIFWTYKGTTSGTKADYKEIAIGFIWTVVTDQTNAFPYSGYITNSSGVRLVIILPNTDLGFPIRVSGLGVSGWSVAPQEGGSISWIDEENIIQLDSTMTYDSIELLCVSPSQYVVISSIGNIEFTK